MGGIFETDEKKKQLIELQKRSREKDFWNDPGKAKKTMKEIQEIESLVKEWEEYAALEKLFTKLFRTKSKLQDEIAVIILRRIVPGRCKYCPL